MPKRIQRRRTKGWRMPEGAVYVGRPSQWGNPWRQDRDRTATERLSRQYAVDRFREECQKRATRDHVGYVAWLGPLRGRDLACWCPLDEPCHVDVLLELANA